QYVKICSLYGAGFYYIPGTDTCLKVGGWVRMQMGYGYNGNMTNGPMVGNSMDRSTTDFSTRNRGYITADARSQTEYGTLRAYIAVGTSNDNAGNSTGAPPATAAAFNANRAFIQFAGFTAGRAQSFYDFANWAAIGYNGGAVFAIAGADTGDPGWQVLAYTAQFGNGFSATISVEHPRDVAINQYNAGTLIAASATSGSNGHKFPDVVANLRVDQAWGSAQIMGALHDASALYYDAARGGHPGDAMGWAVGAGIRLNAPMIGAGDYFQAQINYGVGAISYQMGGTSYSVTNGAESGFGNKRDGIYGTTGDVELTTGWSVGASFEHNWNRQWKTSIYGDYAAADYSDAANRLVCSAAALLTGCDWDFSTWQVGTRTQWNPVPNLDVGLDVIYTQLNSANTGTVASSQDQDAWMVHLRIQRNFYP
ncbi:MAG: porin, partial [Pseudolabrys sp.]